MKLTKTVRAVLIFSTILCLVSGMVFASAAETQKSLGTATFNVSGASKAYWTMGCYVSYTENTSSSLTISKLAVYINNKGDYPITQGTFRVVDANSKEHSSPMDDIPDYGIAPGTNKRIEMNWKSYCSLIGSTNQYSKTVLTHFDTSYSDEWSAWLNAYWSGSNSISIDKNQ